MCPVTACVLWHYALENASNVSVAAAAAVSVAAVLIISCEAAVAAVCA
jgi:hypothetical protein